MARLTSRTFRLTAAISAVFLATALPSGSGAQTLPVGDPLEEYVRILELLGRATPGTVVVRPSPAWRGLPVADSVDHPWRARFPGDRLREPGPGVRTAVDPARLRLFSNSAFPYGGHDGAVWQGKGLTTALDAGATVAWGPLAVTLHPTFTFNQNGSFPLAPVTRSGAQSWGDPWRRVDLPQRFGPDPYWTLDPGQSAVRLTWRGVSAGFGTENLWWGPGIQNSILMSDNAAGLPHAFLATAHPVGVGIGTLDAQWIWGRPHTTRWMDTIPSSLMEQQGVTEDRFFTGAVVAFRPKGLEHVTLGAARAYVLMVPRGGLSPSEYLLVFQRGRKVDFITPENPSGQDQRDQLFSFFMRWALPGSGFESYAEWARNDHFYDVRNLLLEPEHSQGYTLGMRQVLELRGQRILSIRGELTHLEKTSTSRVLGDYSSYYVHSLVPPGYTQRGQIIGAEVGPAGDGQSLAVDLYVPKGRVGVFYERKVRDNDVYYDIAVRDSLGATGHDVQIGGGVRGLWFLDGLDLGAELAFVENLNRYFVPAHDVGNVHVGISVRWNRGARGGRSKPERRP